MKRIIPIVLALSLSLLLTGCDMSKGKYEDANELFDQGSYEEALAIYTELEAKEYLDSADKASDCRYMMFVDYVKENGPLEKKTLDKAGMTMTVSIKNGSEISIAYVGMESHNDSSVTRASDTGEFILKADGTAYFEANTSIGILSANSSEKAQKEFSAEELAAYSYNEFTYDVHTKTGNDIYGNHIFEDQDDADAAFLLNGVELSNLLKFFCEEFVITETIPNLTMSDFGFKAL